MVIVVIMTCTAIHVTLPLDVKWQTARLLAVILWEGNIIVTAPLLDITGTNTNAVTDLIEAGVIVGITYDEILSGLSECLVHNRKCT